MEVVAADIGGTNARFALARLEDGRFPALSHEAVFKTAQYADLRSAWNAYADAVGRPLPSAASIALAGPVRGDTLTLTNTNWIIRVRDMRKDLELEQLTLLNDFEAIAHAVAQLPENHFRPVCGPLAPLPAQGVVTVIGPGTGLGAALLLRGASGYEVIATEAGHASFAPVDETDDCILSHIRKLHGRVSVERVVSGPGLLNIRSTLAELEGASPYRGDDRSLWTAALSGADRLACAALERFCLCLGACAGDLALAHGASGVVIAGGLGLRLADVLASSGFAERFIAKGRFEAVLASTPVKLVIHPQPGLFGAAAAFAREHL